MVTIEDVLRVFPGATVDRTPETLRAVATKAIEPVRTLYRAYPGRANCGRLVGCPFGLVQVDVSLLDSSRRHTARCVTCDGRLRYRAETERSMPLNGAQSRWRWHTGGLVPVRRRPVPPPAPPSRAAKSSRVVSGAQYRLL